MVAVDRGRGRHGALVTPDSAGGRFYIVLARANELDGQYTMLGRITSGVDVVDTIALGDRMKTVKIVEAEP